MIDARTYLDRQGEDGVAALIEALNAIPGAKKSTVGYFKQIAYGSRRPSPELAEGLVTASEIVAVKFKHSDVLDFKALLDARKIHAIRVSAEGKNAPKAEDGEPHAAP